MLDSNFEIITLTKSTNHIGFIMYVVPSDEYSLQVIPQYQRSRGGPESRSKAVVAYRKRGGLSKCTGKQERQAI